MAARPLPSISPAAPASRSVITQRFLIVVDKGPPTA
jgi:hypothetical protein